LKTDGKLDARLDVSKLVAGVYFIHLTTEGGTAVKKIIISH
jgi:hypothetical protein